MSTLLRPEALWFAAAVVIASFWLPGARVTAIAWLAAGTAVAGLPLVAYSAVHFGTFVPPHIGSNTGLLRENWLETRADAAARWFVPNGLAPGDWWGVALVVMIVAGWLTIRSSRSAAFLGVAAVIDIILVMMTTPNDGGGQWGPRYLLFAYVPAALLAAGAVQVVARHRSAARVVIAAALGLALLVQRDGYRELRGTKRIYGRILDFVRNETRPGGVVVTDLWWLDQVIAALDDRQILYAPTREVRRDVLRRLDAANAAGVVIIRSIDESPAFHPGEFTAEEFGSSRGYAPTCLTPTSQKELAERALVATRLQRRAAPCPW
jgi:hypothetical protein